MDSYITGIGISPVQSTEYFSQNVLNEFINNMASFKNVLKKTTSSSDDYDSLLNTILGFSDLAKNGRQLSSDPGVPRSFMNTPMADALNNLMQFFQIAGLSGSSPFNIPDSEKLQVLNKLKTLMPFGLNAVIDNALSLASSLTQVAFIDQKGQVQWTTIPPNRSLQGMLEIEYIGNSNVLVSTKLTDLQNALDISTQIINGLNAVLTYVNQVTVRVAEKSGFVPDYSQANAVDFDKLYRQQAQAYFSALGADALIPTSAPSDLWTMRLQLLDLKTKLLTVVPANNQLVLSINAVTGDLLNAFTASVVSTNEADINRLYNLDRTQFNTVFKVAPRTYLEDGAGGTKQGNFYNNLSQAVTDAQNLNQEQKDNVRSYLYVFQQFYETAFAMLDRINQALTKIGKKTSSG